MKDLYRKIDEIKLWQSRCCAMEVQEEKLVKEIQILKDELEKERKVVDWYAYEARKRCVIEMDGKRLTGINFAKDRWGSFARQRIEERKDI